jgi:hypothetical protein
MPGNFLQRAPQITMTQFHAFRESRPDFEKWELIDGVALRKDRPTVIHQRVVSNLQRLLKGRLGAMRPGR